MRQWTPQAIHEHRRSIVTPKAVIDGPIPVFISSSNYGARQFVSSDGLCSDDIPHVWLTLNELLHPGSETLILVTITACGVKDGGLMPYPVHREPLPPLVGTGEDSTVNAKDVEALLAALAPQIDQALQVCASIDEHYAQAQSKLDSRARLVAMCETRKGYEAACAEAGIEPEDDAVIMGCPCKTQGEPEFPYDPPESVVESDLLKARYEALRTQQFHEEKTPENCCLAARN